MEISLDVQHIFDSGANETRVQVLLDESRKRALLDYTEWVINRMRYDEIIDLNELVVDEYLESLTKK